MIMKRHEKNPIISREDIPNITEELTDVSAVFNPGAVMFDGKILLLLNVLTRGGKTYFVKAFSEDGIHFNVDNDFILFIFPDELDESVYRVYDPRITFADGLYYIVCTVETDNGKRLWITTTSDFEEFNEIGFTLDFSASNGVLLPGKTDDKFAILFTPQAADGVSNDGIYIAYSEDMIFWSEPKLIAKGNKHYWAQNIYPASPPIKLKEGWLCFYNGVTENRVGNSISQIGALILDLNDPAKVVGRTTMNILEPREIYELVGRSPNTVTASGAIIKKEAAKNPELFIYYGAADTTVCLARADVAHVIEKISFETEE